MKNWLIVLTFFSLWLSTQFSSQVQDYMAYALILSFGVLHGANDIFIVSQLKGKHQKFSHILLPYILVVVAVSILFLVSSAAGLALFVLVSAYHFGEQHYKKSVIKNTIYENLIYIAYGSLIMSMIFILKLDKVSKVISEITEFRLSFDFYFFFFLSSLIVFISIFLIMLTKSLIKVDVFREIIMLLVFAIVFRTASLSWAFAIYFILWHSIPSLNDQMVFLYGNSGKSSFLKYLRTSWGYWAISILGLLFLYLILKNKVDYFITVLLYVLAAITFPHVIVMSRIETSKN